MINIWDYADANKVKIIDINDKEYEGKVVCITDTEETYDDKEDSITIEIKGEYIGFLQSEIKEIKIID